LRKLKGKHGFLGKSGSNGGGQDKARKLFVGSNPPPNQELRVLWGGGVKPHLLKNSLNCRHGKRLKSNTLLLVVPEPKGKKKRAETLEGENRSKGTKARGKNLGGYEAKVQHKSTGGANT